MLKTLSALLIFAATLLTPAQANMGLSLFNVNATPSAGCTNTQISSTPAGTFTPATANNGSVVTNSDSTPGWTATNFSVIQTPLFFPLSCTYTFSVMAFQTANPGVTNQNGEAVYVDGRPILSTAATTSNYWTQFVTNSSPATAYNFSAPIKAGWHQIVIGNMVNQNAALTAATMGVHVDRLIVTQTSTVFPTEPAGSVDPFQYPTSALGYPKSAIGTGATLSSGSTSADTSLQAGSGSNATIQFGSQVTGFFQGLTTDPSGTWTQTNNANPYMDYNGTNPHTLHLSPSITISSGDAFATVNDQSNPRYLYFGTDSCSYNSGAPSVSCGNGGILDSYDLNPELDQQPSGELLYIRAQELMTDGVIGHTILMSTFYSQMLQPTASMLGTAWPNSTADFPCSNSGNCTGNLPWGSLVVLPQSYNCNGHSFSTAGVVICTALKNYGAQQNINSEASPSNTLLAEYQPSNSAYNTALTNAVADWQTMSQSLLIVTNNTPTNFAACSPTPCKGGGAPVVAVQAGINQSYPAINFSPPPALLTNIAAISYNNVSGASVTTTGNLAIGDTAVIPIWGSNGVNATYSTVTLSNGTNTASCTITQSTANSTNTTSGIAVCPNLANAYPAGSTVTLTGSLNGANWSSNVWKVNTAVTTAQGGVDKTAQNGTNTAGNTFSLSTATLSQTGDIIIGLFGGVSGASFSAVTEQINGGAGQELGDGTFIFAAAARAAGTAATYSPTYTPTGGGTTTTSAVVVTLKTP